MFSRLQFIIPHHVLGALFGWLANCRLPFIKNTMMRFFIRHYGVDMHEAIISQPEQYLTFNDFFTRRLKPELRPVLASAHEVASPADGVITQIGAINKGSLLQAKKFYFTVTDLLGGDEELASLFAEGSFATCYLSPKDYHRFHMPLSGKLTRCFFIPGRLYSVNQHTTHNISNLFSRNERVITIFNTAAGPMAVILVGAMIVGSIQMAWMNKSVRESPNTNIPFPQNYELQTGDELGLFKMGSTIILLFPKKSIEWSIKSQARLRYGQVIGQIILP